MNTLSALVRSAAEPLVESVHDYDSLLEVVGSRHFVLIGEATHGTHEFYRERAEITKRLIEEKGFNGVVVEADWPDAYRVNRFVRGAGQDREAVEALGGFIRFPQWMWRNADVLDFIGWLRTHNEERADSARTGFYGLDIYSMHASAEAVIAYLDRVDAAAAARARRHYSCLDRFGTDTQTYGLATGLGMAPSCEKFVIAELVALRRREMEYLRHNGQTATDEYFCAEQNARVVRDAEEYYRHMFRREFSSWNLRETHMMQTLVSLQQHLARYQAPARMVIWAHNSHVGDARATQMSRRGELSLGQLVREQFKTDCLLIGQTTYSGTVTAAPEWDAPAERRNVAPAEENSIEALFHDTGASRFLLNTAVTDEVTFHLDGERSERAIGVIYRPDAGVTDHYFKARLAHQFDVVLHFDRTRAVEPLERTTRWEAGEVAETFPTGL